MSHANKIIIVSGSSGSGKTTLVNHLLSYQSPLNLEFSISACTRQKRQVEINGKHYIFLSKLEFKNKIASNEFENLGDTSTLADPSVVNDLIENVLTDI